MKVLNSYTENIESSGWFGRFMKNARLHRSKTLTWHLALSNFYGFFGTFAAYNFVGADPYIIFFL